MRILLAEDHAELSRWISKALQDARLTPPAPRTCCARPLTVLKTQAGLALPELDPKVMRKILQAGRGLTSVRDIAAMQGAKVELLDGAQDAGGEVRIIFPSDLPIFVRLCNLM